MGTYLSPGVYVEEVSGGVKPIAGVGTSTGAFVGFAEKGVVNKAVPITNWSQFVNEFGSLSPSGYLAYAVYGFFAEGGTTCYVVRVAANDKAKAASANITDKSDGTGTPVINVTARSVGDYGDRSKGTWGNKVEIVIEDPDPATGLSKTDWFRMRVRYDKQDYETFDLSIKDRKKDDVLDIESSFIEVKVVDPAKRPANSSSEKAYKLDGGDDGTKDASGKAPDLIGDASNKNGLNAFNEVDDINIVAIPDICGQRAEILKALNYCKNRKDCFFIADPPENIPISDIKDFKIGTGKYAGNAFNNSYGALYYPWITIKDPRTKENDNIPPSGVVAGTLAYTDSTRGVHKAPAGVSEGILDSVLNVERIVTKGEHDILNPLGINVIRSFPGLGICVWGARTLSADSEWLYINIRRLLLYIEESVDEGTQWVVFEPNDPALWGKVKRNITAFLTRVWRDGALFGATPEEAFFVKVDEENNPPAVRDAGQLIIEVGVAPVKPAEFVIIRISQMTLKK